MTHAQAIINYRMGIRRNNQLLFQSAVYKIADLFLGRNHPFYQIIKVYSLCNYLSMPKEVQRLMGESFTLSLSNDLLKGEDCNFVLENVNKINQH